MQDAEEILRDNLCRLFSTKVDLKTYEDVIVKMERGDVRKMSLLGRVTLKNPHLVMINFVDSPSAIKCAKLALQKPPLGLNPQQEGVFLYIQIPDMTRERREKIANDPTLFNTYKQTLNEIYTRCDKKCCSIRKADAAHGTHCALLHLKKVMEERGQQMIEAKRRELLREVI